MSIYAHGERAEQLTECVSLLGDRMNNQDRALAVSDDRRLLLLVADGMGGHADGERAAQCVVDTALRLFGELQSLPAAQLLQRIALQAHLSIQQIRPDLPNLQQPRTTLIGAIGEGDRVLFAHAGDSRGYHIRDGQPVHRTLDHSAVSILIKRGELSEQEAKHHPLRNRVSRCLGGKGRPPALELTPCPPLMNDDEVLLCSDGFWEPLSAAELCSSAPLETLARLATQRKAHHADNCTALRFRFQAL